MKKITSLIFRFLIFGILIICFSSCNQNKEENDKYTLFVYMSGNDLESETSAGSNAIDGFLNYGNPSNVDIYILTGGAKKWENELIPNDTVTLFNIKNKQLKIVEDYGNQSMGDKNTLVRFSNFMHSFEDTKKILMFWGHGSQYGICSDEKYSNNYLSYKDLSEGLQDNFFDLIIFNSCYSSNLDLLAYISDKAHYAIASEAAFPSLGFDYTKIISRLDNNKMNDMIDIGQGIIDDCFSKYNKSSLKDQLTLSLINLNELSDYLDTINSYVYSIYFDSINWIKSATKANNISDKGVDLIDLCEHFNPNDSFIQIIKSCVDYEIHGSKFDIGGIYIYYKDKVTKADLINYKNACFFDQYLKFLSAKKMYTEGVFIEFKTSLKDNDFLENCTIDQHSYIYSSLFSYSFIDDSNVICEDVLGINSYYNDENSLSYLTVDKQANFTLSLFDLDISYYYFSVEEEFSKTRITYYTDVIMNGKNGKLFFTYEYSDNKKYDGSYEILGFVEDTDDFKDLFINDIKIDDTFIVSGKEFKFSGEGIVRKYRDELVGMSINVYDIYGNKYSYIRTF